MLADVLSGLLTLVRIGEAHMVNVVVDRDVRGGSGRGDLEHVVVSGLFYDCKARTGSNGTDHHLQALVLQGVVSVHGLLGIVLVVLELVLEADAAVQRVRRTYMAAQVLLSPGGPDAAWRKTLKRL